MNQDRSYTNLPTANINTSMNNQKVNNNNKDNNAFKDNDRSKTNNAVEEYYPITPSARTPPNDYNNR